MTAVYKLDDSDSFRNWDFANVENSDYDATVLMDLFDTYWDVPLREVWPHFPFHVQSQEETEHLPLPNLQMFLTDVLVVDGLAKMKLEKILSPYGEFLPIYNHEQELFLFHLLNRLPALDLEQSVVDYYPGSNRIAHIREYVFQKEVVEGQLIFEVDQDSRAQIFVTDRFIKLVEEHQLKGLNYILFWRE